MKKTIISTLVVSMLLFVLAVPLQVTAQDEPLEMIRTDDGAFAFFLPEGWTWEGGYGAGLTIASSEETLAKSQESDYIPEPDTLVIHIDTLPQDKMDGLSRAEFVDQLIHYLAEQAENPPILMGPDDIMIGDHPGALSVGRGDNSGRAFIMFPIAPGWEALTYTIMAPDEIENANAVTLQILTMVRYSLMLEETFDSGTVEFNYPTGWVVLDESPFYGIVSEDSVFEATDIEAGQFQALIVNLAEAGIETASLSKIEAVTAFADILLEPEEGEEVTEPGVVNVNGIEMAAIGVTRDGANVGAVYAVEFPTGDLYAIAFATAPGEMALYSLTALNMLFSLQIAIQ